MDEIETPITSGRRARCPSSTPGATAFASFAPSSTCFARNSRCHFFTGIGRGVGVGLARPGIPVITSFFETGLVPRLPTAVLSTGLMLLAFLSAAAA